LQFALSTTNSNVEIDNTAGETDWFEQNVDILCEYLSINKNKPSLEYSGKPCKKEVLEKLSPFLESYFMIHGDPHEADDFEKCNQLEVLFFTPCSVNIDLKHMHNLKTLRLCVFYDFDSLDLSGCHRLTELMLFGTDKATCAKVKYPD
jgi:hypothetical protein